MKKLSGKIALITGGTTGIGAATAKLFQANGAQVIVTGINPKTLSAARDDMPDIDVRACDVSDLRAIEALFDDVRQTYGRIDVLFANAGVSMHAASSQVDEAIFDAQFNVNVRGTFFTLKNAAPLISDGGAIILTSSIGATSGSPGMSVYGATKAAIRSFGRSFAGELSPRRIRVNTITPGPIETPIFSKLGLQSGQLDTLTKHISDVVPLRRFGRSDEVAAAALYLASDDSTYITGAELVIDGGITGI